MERVVAPNGVVFYRSELIPCIHGFSTRIGGVSYYEHTKGLNLVYDRGDEPQIVLENLRLFSDALEIDREDIISVSQIHSSTVRYVNYENRGEGYFRDELFPCDGYLTDDPDICLGVRTADCVPVLLYAPANDSFDGAVAAVHAGWRGTSLGIVREAVERLYLMGADLKDIKAAIGPSIGACCYSVRKDFYDAFMSSAGRSLTEEFVTPVGEDHWVADLKGANRRILEMCGVVSENIDVSDMCTCCRPDEFYSHRYSKGKRGTMLSVITKAYPKKGI